MTRVRFTAILRPVEGGTYVDIPSDAVEALGATGRTSVVGTIDGQPFTFQIMPYTFEGEGRKVVMGVTKAVRAAIGKDVGDAVTFELERDAEPRSANIEVPSELTFALDGDADARAAWERLAPSHRREYAMHVADAKRPETRVRRAAAAVERLRG